MEHRIAEYTINGQNITLPKVTDIEDIRLIFNETQKVLICSTASKGNITTIITDPVAGTSTVVVPTSVCTINPNDKLTIKCDYGDDLSSVAKQGENKEATNSAIYNDTHNVAQFFGITAATEFTPLTTEEITNEINTLWEGL